MTKKITLVTNYFPPEKGAAANRMHSLASTLREYGYQVHIVCPLPNYPKGKIFEGYNRKFYRKTIEDKLIINRLWVWPSKAQNKFLRLLSMLSFSFSLTLFFIFKRSSKQIIIQYSPVFVGFTAVFWSWVFRKKIVLNISDLWPLAGLEMGILKKGFYYSVLKKMEHFCYKRAALIIGQSKEILTHIKNAGILNTQFLYRNLPRFEAPKIPQRNDSENITLVYAGLLGVAQGMLNICENLHLPRQITMHIYGGGPEANDIEQLNSPQIVFHGEIDRDQLHQQLLHYDIAFIPLANRIYGSVPSKIFEFSRLGLAILYYAGGEGEDIVKNSQLGWTVPVKRLDLLQEFIDGLSIKNLQDFPKQKVQHNVLRKYNFEEQFEAFLKKLEAV